MKKKGGLLAKSVSRRIAKNQDLEAQVRKLTGESSLASEEITRKDT